MSINVGSVGLIIVVAPASADHPVRFVPDFSGCTTGFGQHYVDVALENGHKVVATSRKPEKLPKFKAATDDNFLAVALDVTDKDSIEKAFKAALDKFKQIDVVCNNAGFGLSGVFESLSEKQIRMQMGKYFHQSTSGTKLIVPINFTHLPSRFHTQRLISSA